MQLFGTCRGFGDNYAKAENASQIWRLLTSPKMLYWSCIVYWHNSITRRKQCEHNISDEVSIPELEWTVPLHGSVTKQCVNSSGTLRMELRKNASSRLRVPHWQRRELRKTKQHLPLNDSQQPAGFMAVVVTEVERRYWSCAWRHRATVKVDTITGNDLQRHSWTDVLWWETNWDSWQLTNFM
jgi:hypothetical protein